MTSTAEEITEELINLFIASSMEFKTKSAKDFDLAAYIEDAKKYFDITKYANDEQRRKIFPELNEQMIAINEKKWKDFYWG